MQTTEEMPIFFEPLDNEEIKKILRQSDFFYKEELAQSQAEIKLLHWLSGAKEVFPTVKH